MSQQIGVWGRRLSTPTLDAYRTTGPSPPTVHLLGPGRVVLVDLRARFPAGSGRPS